VTRIRKRRFAAGAVVLLGLMGRLLADEAHPFGQSEASESALIGVLYDLKQTPDHKPTGMNFGNYFKVADEFLSKNWDESVLNRYYRLSSPIFTTQIYIPSMGAGLGPKAFGAQDKIQPSLWIIHYKGQVSPPEDGTYRFVGSGDDIMAVAINGKTVMAAPLHDPTESLLPLTKWKTPEPGGMNGAGYGDLINGDWIDMKKDDVLDLDVIIGECPGGLFSAFLMIEKQGGNYQRDKDHHAILPIFQVAAYDTKPINNPVNAPEFAKGFPVWKCYQ
jgi:hypothetical protein